MQQARAGIFEYIEVWYNHYRLTQPWTIIVRLRFNNFSGTLSLSAKVV